MLASVGYQKPLALSEVCFGKGGTRGTGLELRRIQCLQPEVLDSWMELGVTGIHLPIGLIHRWLCMAIQQNQTWRWTSPEPINWDKNKVEEEIPDPDEYAELEDGANVIIFYTKSPPQPPRTAVSARASMSGKP